MKAALWPNRLTGLVVFTFVLLFLFFLASPHGSSRTPVGSETDNGQLGAVVSESALCTEIGIDLLKAGGNAADALVGTTFCVGVTGMYHSGIGGGGFALVRSSMGTYESIDFRETAPAAALEDMFKDNVEASIHGGLSSGVPGQLRGLEYIHQKHGKLPWSRVLKPAIAVARNGFVVSEDLVAAMGIPKAHDRRKRADFQFGNAFLTEDPVWAEDFAPNGTRVGLGDVMRRQRYADTLEKIADEGADVFYCGNLAEEMVAAVEKANGSMTLEDLDRYSVVVRPPVEIDFRGYRILGCGVPASGAVTLSILKVVEGYDDFAFAGTENLSMHRLVEAMRFGYGKRASFGDPDFLDEMSGFEAGMLNDSYAASIRKKILDSQTQNISAYDPNGFENHDSHGTSQISTVDASGMAISLTTTINLFFGSHIMVPGSGIILNDQMNDFSIPNITNVFGYVPSPANYIRPLKRPLSSTSPLIAVYANNTLHSVLGSAGGSRIITAVAQNAIAVLLRNKNAYDALEEPRLHDQLLPNVVQAEYLYDNGTTAFLTGREHEVKWVPPGYSSAQLLRRLWNGTLEAAAEPRQRDSKGMVV